MMPESDKRSTNDAPLDAPGELVDDLSGLFQAEAETPPPEQVDTAILHMADRRALRRLVPWRELGWVAAAVAAVLAVACLVPTGRLEAKRPVATPPLVVHEDIDGNGHVDILDALQLARLLQSTRTPKAEWDLNGDGVVDRADVDTVANAAVRLDRGSL